MTLDEAIKHCEEVAEEQGKLCKGYDDASGYSRSHNESIRVDDAKRCERCAKEHRQLAGWLKELKALKAEPCSDAISRNAAVVQLHHNKTGDDDIDVIIEKDIATIQALPPVTPKQKTGKWITFEDYRSNGDVYYKRRCSNCGECSDYPYNFCPQCGERKEWCDE